MNSTKTKPNPEESKQKMEDYGTMTEETANTLEDGARIVNENVDEDVKVDDLPDDVQDLFDGKESSQPTAQDFQEEDILNTTVEVEKNAERLLTEFAETAAQLNSQLSLMAERMADLSEEMDEHTSYAVRQRQEAVEQFVRVYAQILQRVTQDLGGEDQ